MNKPIAVINDNTGEITYVLEEYNGSFPLNDIHMQITKRIEKVANAGTIGIYKVELNGFDHIINTGSYSIVYEVTS